MLGRTSVPVVMFESELAIANIILLRKTARDLRMIHTRNVSGVNLHGRVSLQIHRLCNRDV